MMYREGGMSGIAVPPEASASVDRSERSRAKRKGVPAREQKHDMPEEQGELHVDEWAGHERRIVEAAEHQGIARGDALVPIDNKIISLLIKDGLLLEKPLGVGGMGATFLARQMRLGDRRVVAKLMLPPKEGSFSLTDIAGFEREAKTLAQLNHPNVVYVYTFSANEHGGVLGMEYVKGKDLNDVIEQANERHEHVDAKIGLDIALKAARGLEAAHNADIVHRDVKPSNILLSDDPDVAAYGGDVKLGDFGISRGAGTEGRSIDASLDNTGISGTYAYMSPERFGGSVNKESDVYALGVTLYELFTGQHPLRDDDTKKSEGVPPSDPDKTERRVPSKTEALVKKIVDDNYVITPPQNLNPKIPDDLNFLILAMMSREESRRPPITNVVKRLTDLGVALESPYAKVVARASQLKKAA